MRMKKIMKAINDWNNNWVGDVIGGACLFGTFYLLLWILPAIFG